jgi:hypothetical protein
MTLLPVAPSRVCWCSIEGGAIAVWDIIGFQLLLNWYLVTKESLAGQVMMIEATSTSSMHTLVKTQDQAMAMCACIVSLLKVRDRNSTLGMKILRSTYGWTRRHQG